MGASELGEAAFLRFESHRAAAEALEQVGYRNVQDVADFAPAQLVQSVNDLLEPEGVTLLDVTTSLPDTPHAAYQALSIAGFTAAASCRKDSSAAFVVMRTAENSPSFLFGHHWALVQVHGRERADALVRSVDTPCGLVFYRDRQIAVPSCVCAVDEVLAARLVAYEITRKDEFFRCGLCEKPFARHVGEHTVVDEVALTACQHMFHRRCSEEYVQRTRSALCPLCGGDPVNGSTQVPSVKKYADESN
jgi:hypothetical protein